MKKQPAVSPFSSGTVLARKKTAFIIAGVFIGLVYVGLNIGIWMYAKNRAKSTAATANKQAAPSSTPTPTPTPRPFLSKGVYEFSVSAGEGKPALVTGGALDPVDPVPGGKQTFEVTAVPGAETLNVRLVTDTKEKPVPLAKDPSAPNLWRGSWTMDDTYFYVYTLNVTGMVGGKEIKFPLMFR